MTTRNRAGCLFHPSPVVQSVGLGAKQVRIDLGPILDFVFRCPRDTSPSTAESAAEEPALPSSQAPSHGAPFSVVFQVALKDHVIIQHLKGHRAGEGGLVPFSDVTNCIPMKTERS